MIRVGADFSAARQGLQGATRELNRFKRDTERIQTTISGRRGLGGISDQYRTLSRSVQASLSQLRGAKGIGGVASALGSLRPALSTATNGLRGMSVAAGGAAAALGPLSVGIAAVTAALAALAVGIYRASQPAVKFEADIERLNFQLGKNSRAFMDWARSMGLAKTTAAEMGATYSTLLSSFIRDSDELANQTMQLVHASRVIASRTGRTIEDVTERIRSGLLGNTEAIEDLGVFVNVAMIESTDAFRRFAKDKSWEQLDFQLQQQIRLAAILEQTYKRYGTEVQQNVMIKQERFTEQLKNIKLNLSQAFLPVWDVVLPALTRFAEALANATESLARFMFMLRGWDYDEMTRGTDQATDRITDYGDAYEDLADSVREARKELASFDEIHQLGEFGGGSGGSGGTGGGGGPGIPAPPSGTGPLWDIQWPDIALPAWLKNLRIEFQPPTPPDAGMGAVATAVLSTTDRMISDSKARMAQWWSDLQSQTQAGLNSQRMAWEGYVGALTGTVIPGLVAGTLAQFGSMWSRLDALTAAGVTGQLSQWSTLSAYLSTMISALTQNIGTMWGGMWTGIGEQTVVGSIGIQSDIAGLNAFVSADTEAMTTTVSTGWIAMLTGMLASLREHRPLIETEWSGLKVFIESIKEPLVLTEWNWKTTLTTMLQNIQTINPGLIGQLALLGASTLALVPQFEGMRSAWDLALESMRATAEHKLSTIQAKISETLAMLVTLQTMLGKSIPDVGSIVSSAGESIRNALNTFRDALTPQGASDLPGRNLPVIGYVLRGLDWVQQGTEPLAKALEPYFVPGAGLTGAGNALRGGSTVVGKWGDDFFNWLGEMWQGLGKLVPQFATGGIVHAPTLAMIGEAGKEAVIPLENTSFIDTLASAIGTAVVQAQQLAQGGKSDQRGDIIIQIDGAELARILYPYQQQEQQRRGPAVIRTV
jgi:hypothetical protein